MQHPKLIVLGLLAKGMQYGLEMEKFIDASRMRLWARIGSSTIYKTLLDLQKDGAVSAKPGVAERGPGKTVYALTKKGHEDLSQQVAAALTSEESVYSDRIAGMVFALALPPDEGRARIAACAKGLDRAHVELAQEKEKQKGHAMAQIVLDFYTKVYKAEQEAMEEALKLLDNE